MFKLILRSRCLMGISYSKFENYLFNAKIVNERAKSKYICPILNHTRIFTTSVSPFDKSSLASPSSSKYIVRVPPKFLLAMNYQLNSDIDPVGWWFSEKLDGIRAMWCGSTRTLITRQGNPICCPGWFIEKFPIDSNLQLDGELFVGRGKFNETVSITRSCSSGDRWKCVKFHVFDVPSLNKPWEDRMDWMNENLIEISEYITLVLHTKCASLEMLNESMDKVTSNGGEGLMLRKPFSYYEPKRSSTLLKMKKFMDDEAVVIGYTEGKGKHKGRVGALKCRYKNGSLFNIGSGLTDFERENPPSVGSLITFQYFELSNSGSPRFPTYLRAAIDK